MKKILSFIMLAIMMLCISACKGEPAKLVTVVIGEDVEKVYEVDLNKVEITEGALSVLKYLETEKSVDLEYSNSEYGAFVTKVGGLTNDVAKGEYIYFYTTVEADKDTSEYAVKKSYEGKELVSAKVGISQMKVEEGAIIYIGIYKMS